MAEWIDKEFIQIKAMLTGSLSITAVEQTRCFCPGCGNQLRRLARKGLLQRTLYPLLGYYPWECFACRTKRMVRARGQRTFHRIWDEVLDDPLDNPFMRQLALTSQEESSSAADSSPETEHSQGAPQDVA
jgi:hypothetical protein